MDNPESSWLILAAGGIIFRSEGNKKQVLIIHRNRYNDYSLPKGKLVKGENFEEAAIRELFEETGYKTEITGIADVQTRIHQGKMKITVFYVMRISELTQFELNQNTDNEVKETLWVDLDNLSTLLTYPEQTNLILKILKSML